MRIRPALATFVIVAILLGTRLAAPVAAQWIVYPTPGVPRTADGKPDMAAPAPHTSDGKPDLSGLWQQANPLPCDGINRVCTDLPVRPFSEYS